jgi:hypothetical protein
MPGTPGDFFRTRPPHPVPPPPPGHRPPPGFYQPYTPTVICTEDNDEVLSGFSDYVAGPCMLVCRTDPTIRCSSSAGDCQMQGGKPKGIAGWFSRKPANARQTLTCDGQEIVCP